MCASVSPVSPRPGRPSPPEACAGRDVGRSVEMIRPSPTEECALSEASSTTYSDRFHPSFEAMLELRLSTTVMICEWNAETCEGDRTRSWYITVSSWLVVYRVLEFVVEVVLLEFVVLLRTVRSQVQFSFLAQYSSVAGRSIDNSRRNPLLTRCRIVRIRSRSFAFPRCLLRPLPRPLHIQSRRPRILHLVQLSPRVLNISSTLKLERRTLICINFLAIFLFCSRLLVS